MLLQSRRMCVRAWAMATLAQRGQRCLSNDSEQAGRSAAAIFRCVSAKVVDPGSRIRFVALASDVIGAAAAARLLIADAPYGTRSRVGLQRRRGCRRRRLPAC